MEEALPDREDLNDWQVAIYVAVAVFLVLMAGMMSGLTLGLMSLDSVDLEVLKRSGTPKEREYAARIMPVIKHQHILLVTLLLCNAAATEALPIFLDRLADPVTAVVLSVTVVLIFGEILPQAVCTRYGLQVGAYASWIVRGLMWLCYPIAWPTGKLLDYMLGPDHSALFRRAQLKALVGLHGETEGMGGTLSPDEIHIIQGALDLTSKTAWRAMTPLKKVFMLSEEAELDEDTLQMILMSGHSRVPIHKEGDREDIIGLILVKELVLVDPRKRLKVKHMKVRPVPKLSADTPMYDMLKLFETGGSHMAVLTKPSLAVNRLPSLSKSKSGFIVSTTPYDEEDGLGDNELEPILSPTDLKEVASHHPYDQVEVDSSKDCIGIITIEDVIEELLQEEIVDETDLFVDNEQTSRVNAAMLTRSLPPRLRHVLTSGHFTTRVGRLGALGPPRLDLRGNHISPAAVGFRVSPEPGTRGPSPGPGLPAASQHSAATGPPIQKRAGVTLTNRRFDELQHPLVGSEYDEPLGD